MLVGNVLNSADQVNVGMQIAPFRRGICGQPRTRFGVQIGGYRTPARSECRPRRVISTQPRSARACVAADAVIVGWVPRMQST
jgi:hypothetical protein